MSPWFYIVFFALGMAMGEIGSRLGIHYLLVCCVTAVMCMALYILLFG